MLTPGRNHAGMKWTHVALIVGASALLVMALTFLSQTPLVVK